MPRSKRTVDEMERDAMVEQMARNAAKMRGAGPDTPIPWNAYGTFPHDEKKMGRMDMIKAAAMSALAPFQGPTAQASPGKKKGKRY